MDFDQGCAPDRRNPNRAGTFTRPPQKFGVRPSASVTIDLRLQRLVCGRASVPVLPFARSSVLLFSLFQPRPMRPSRRSPKPSGVKEEIPLSFPHLGVVFSLPFLFSSPPPARLGALRSSLSSLCIRFCHWNHLRPSKSRVQAAKQVDRPRLPPPRPLALRPIILTEPFGVPGPHLS